MSLIISIALGIALFFVGCAALALVITHFRAVLITVAVSPFVFIFGVLFWYQYLY